MAAGEQHALELYFDAEAERAVRALWRDLDNAHIASLGSAPQPWRPHVSLAVGNEVDVERARKAVAEAARTWTAPPISLSHVGVFVEPWTVVFLGVTPTPELLRVQRAAHEGFVQAVTSAWPYYEPGDWVPHCTLATHVDPDSLGDALQVTGAATLPIRTYGVELAVVDIATGDRTPVARLGS